MDIYIILFVLLVPLIAKIILSNTYNKCRNIENKINLSGQEIAKKIVEKNNLDSIYIVSIAGKLTDHYDVNRKVIRLSSSTFLENTIASLCIAAYESSHALQDKENSFLLKLKSMLFPAIKWGILISYILIIVGLFTKDINLTYLAVALIALGLLFQMITLPVEIQASKKAIEELKRQKLIKEKEEEDVLLMLNALRLKPIVEIFTQGFEMIRNYF